MDTFTLTITLGNDAMREPDDVAQQLEIIAGKLRDGYTSGKVVDVNGNSVGEFRFA